MSKKIEKNIEESEMTRYLPHRQLFKPKNFIENIFVGLSIFSVVVLILANIVNIDTSLKFLLPKLIADNFPQIMHFAHIVLIVYVIYEMRTMLERIKTINPTKEKYNREIERFLRFFEEISLIKSIKISINKLKETLSNTTEKQDGCKILESELNKEIETYEKDIKEKVIKSTLNSIIKEKGKSNQGRWVEWIKNYINIDKGKKSEEICDINRHILIANDNLTLFYAFWLCIWAGWLLLYIGMFCFGFMKQSISDPLDSHYSVTIHDLCINKNGNFYYTRTDTLFNQEKKNNQDTVFQDTVFHIKFDYPNTTYDYTTKEIRNKDIVIFSDTIPIKFNKDTVKKGILEFCFFNWIDVSDKKYRIFDKNDSSIIDCDIPINIEYEKAKDSTYNSDYLPLNISAANEKRNIHDIVPIIRKGKGKIIEKDTLKYFKIHDGTKATYITKIYAFIENTLGHLINFFFFLLYLLLSYRYVSRKTIDNFSEEYFSKTHNCEDCCNKSKINKYEKCKEEKSNCERNRIHFMGLLVSASILTIGFIALDYYMTIYSHEEYLRVIAQLLVSSFCCISMVFLFGQMNNGCLKLPPLAIWVMYFYAAVQLFAPFRGYWIISEKFIPPNTFSFFVTTLCFVSKFMVFFIIRWLFSEGRIAYYFLNTAYTSRAFPKYDEIFEKPS